VPAASVEAIKQGVAKPGSVPAPAMLQAMLELEQAKLKVRWAGGPMRRGLPEARDGGELARQAGTPPPAVYRMPQYQP
jgi:hypothetical protein